MKFSILGRPPPPSKPGEINHGFVDRFTLAHFLIGMLYAALQMSFWWAFALAIAWEIFENPMKSYLPRFFPNGTQDTWRNVTGDVLAVLLGWATFGLALI